MGLPFRAIRAALLVGVLASCADSGSPSDPRGGDPPNSRNNPAQTGETLTLDVDGAVSGTGRIRLELLGHLDGASALEAVLSANQFNSDPPPGHEYLLARFRLEIVSLANPSEAFDMWDGDWEAFSSTGAQYPEALFGVCCLDPPLEREGFAGASWEGWVPFYVDPTDVGPLGVYQRDGFGAEAWFRLR